MSIAPSVGPCVPPTPHRPIPSFSNIVSGEWFGHEAAFSTRTGSALSVEERFVPDAFREWDVEVLGFDTVTSTKVTSVIYQKRIRALPSVGCEADAVVPDIATRTYENFFGFTDGSFSNGPPSLRDAGEWGFTLVDPTNPAQRARIEFGLDASESMGKDSLEFLNTKVTVYIERREADFCDGQLLPGCGGMGGFASETPMDPSDLDGTWDVRGEAYEARRSWELEKSSTLCTRANTRQKVSLVLPRGLSLSIRRSHSSVRIAVGWLHENTRVVLQRTYDEEGILLSVSKDLETRHI